MLKLEILTEDKELAAVCQLYWEVDNEFEFVHKVSALAQTAKIDKKKLPSVVKEACNAYVPSWKCEDCKKPYVFSSRSDLTSNKRYLIFLLRRKSLMFVAIAKEREERKRRRKEKRG